MRNFAIRVLLDAHKLRAEELRDLKRTLPQVNSDERPYVEKLIVVVEGIIIELREAIAIVEAAP